MNQKTITNQNLKRKESSRLKQRRAVADIISTMLLMGVTVTGASTLTYFMNDAFVTGTLGTATTLDASSLNVLLLAYDTRDSHSLLMLSGVNNTLSGSLCGITCSLLYPDTLPEFGGSEFIVLQIQNNGMNSIFLSDVALNNVNHPWDISTSTAQLIPGQYPADGMFSLFPIGNPIIQNETAEIQSGQIVNLLVKLGPDDPDINLNKGIHVFLNTGGVNPVKFLIESGDAR